jgi:hypothetical protein
MDLAVHAAVLATLSALSGFLLAALMLLTGLSLSALLLLAGLALPTLLRITLLLLLLARILLFVRHVDVLQSFESPPYDKTITLEAWRGSYRRCSDFRQRIGKSKENAAQTIGKTAVPQFRQRSLRTKPAPLCRAGSAC